MKEEFKKFAVKGLGLSSMTLDRYQSATDAYINPTNSHWYFGPVDGSRLGHFAQNLRQAVACAEDTVWIYGEKCAWVRWRGVASKPIFCNSFKESF